SDHPSAAKRSGRNDLPGPVGIHGMPSVSSGRAGSKLTWRIVSSRGVPYANVTATMAHHLGPISRCVFEPMAPYPASSNRLIRCVLGSNLRGPGQTHSGGHLYTPSDK